MAMHNDEAALSLDAVMVLDGRIDNPFDVGWYGHPTLWAFLNAAVLAVSGVTLFGARLLAVAIGTATVGLTYLMARLLYSRAVAVTAAFLLATYHFHIHFSRIGMNNIADPFFGVLVMIALTIGIYTNRRLFFGLTGLLMGLALYFYMGARLFVPLTLLLGASWLLVHPVHLRRWRRPGEWYPALLALAGLIFASGPLLYIFYRWPASFTLRFQREGLTQEKIALLTAKNGWSLPELLANHLRQALLFFVNVADKNFDFYDTQRPLLWGVTAGLFLLGVIVAISRVRRWSYHVPLAWYGLAAIFGGMLMDYPVKTPRFVTLAPVACLFVAFAIVFLYEQMALTWPGREHLLLAAAVVVTCLLAVQSLWGYFGDYRQRGTYGNLSSRQATLLSQALAEEAAGTQLWFLGDNWVSVAGFPIFRYLAPHIDGFDVNRKVLTSAHVPVGDERAVQVFAAVPERGDESAHVVRRYPHGVRRDVIWPQTGEVILLVYIRR